jgi:hypothetical protein
MSSPDLLYQLAATGFFLLPFVAGLIVALINWARHPRVSLLAGGGCAIVIFAGLLWMVFHAVAAQGFGFDRTVYSLVSLASGFLRMVGACLILAAVFIDRREPKKPRFDDEDAPLAVPRRDDPRIQTR